MRGVEGGDNGLGDMPTSATSLDPMHRRSWYLYVCERSRAHVHFSSKRSSLTHARARAHTRNFTLNPSCLWAGRFSYALRVTEEVVKKKECVHREKWGLGRRDLIHRMCVWRSPRIVRMRVRG